MIALLLAQASVAASAPIPPCTTAEAAQAAPAGWNAVGRVADGGRLTVGRTAAVALRPGARLAVAPAKPAAAGASLRFDAPRGGRWSVLLDLPVWVDLVRGGATIASATHGHGARCSGVRKRVTFDLEAGRYVVQLSGEAGAEVRVMVAPG